MKTKATESSQSDDREIDPEEIADAADETPTEVISPEVDARTEQLTEWDDAPGSHGTVAPKTASDEDDGEDTIAAKLVYEGTDEAERERRMAAADPDFEP